MVLTIIIPFPLIVVFSDLTIAWLSTSGQLAPPIAVILEIEVKENRGLLLI